MISTLVTAKVHPDLDGVACALAYADLLNQTGNSAEGLIFGSPQAEVRFFMDKQGIALPVVDPDTNNNWQSFILVDASSMKGMPSAVKSAQVIEIIDHREGDYHPADFLIAKPQIEMVGAAATLIVEKFQAANKLPTPDHVQLLYGAIYHNTLNFLSLNTTDRDRAAAKWLEQNFKLSSELVKDMFTFATNHILSNLHQSLIEDSKNFTYANTNICAFQITAFGINFALNRHILAAAIDKLTDDILNTKIFLILSDPDQNNTYLYSQNFSDVLSKAMDTKFDSFGWASLRPMLLRKQIMPKIKQALEKS